MASQVLFGFDTPVAHALAWSLRKTAFVQGTPGEVKTGSGSSGASFDRKRGCWVLHNSAWWHFGGAHSVVNLAAQRLARKSPEAANKPGDLVLTGSALGVVEDDESDDRWGPYTSAVWEIASASHNAWRDFQITRRIEREAKEASLSVAVYRLFRGGRGVFRIGGIGLGF